MFSSFFLKFMKMFLGQNKINYINSVHKNKKELLLFFMYIILLDKYMKKRKKIFLSLGICVFFFLLFYILSVLCLYNTTLAIQSLTVISFSKNEGKKRHMSIFSFYCKERNIYCAERQKRKNGLFLARVTFL